MKINENSVILKIMNTNPRRYSLIDKTIWQCHSLLETLFIKPVEQQKNPATGFNEHELTSTEKKKSIGFMRVNHSGEVCAQALYHGQMVTVRNHDIRTLLADTAEEERNHLVWCQKRLNELGGHVSYLNFFWYINSFLIGLLAGLSGDSLSLGFMEETEKQVVAHLASHFYKLPSMDLKSRKIIEQMQRDEIQHRKKANVSGAQELPYPVKKLMSLQAKVMTTLAYRI